MAAENTRSVAVSTLRRETLKKKNDVFALVLLPAHSLQSWNS